MNEKQKSKLGNIVLLLVYLALASGLGFMFIRNENLAAKVESQDMLLKKYNITDTTYAKDAEKIKRDLNNITSSFSYIKNGKKLSGNALLDYIYKLQSEKDSIQFSLDYAMETYGFKISQTKRKSKTGTNTTVYAFNNTRADSASITYYFFKDRIYKKKDGWYADQTSKKDLEAVEKEINEKLMPQAREMLRKQGDTSRKN